MAEGRVVLLTGAAGGLGAVMTAALLADGHAIAALDRDAAALKRLCCRARRQASVSDCRPSLPISPPAPRRWTRPSRSSAASTR